MTTTHDAVSPYDLHLHTHWSYDALVSVEETFKAAHESGVRCIAITEHHVMDSAQEVMQVAQRFPEVRYVPGAELTVTTSLGAVDLLFYNMPLDPGPPVQAVLDEYHEWQRAYGAAFARAMRKAGYDFSDTQWVALLESYRPGHIIAVQGHTHVRNGVLRAYFIERGFIRSEEEYAPLRQAVAQSSPLPPYPAVERVAPVGKAAGAVIAIAHPYGYFQGADEKRMRGFQEECLLDGIECAHQSVPHEFTATYREYCVKHDLISTGGSDCHTLEDVRAKIGRHGGPAEWFEEFEARVDRGGRA